MLGVMCFFFSTASFSVQRSFDSACGLAQDDKFFTFSCNKYGTGKPVPYGVFRPARLWRAHGQKTIPPAFAAQNPPQAMGFARPSLKRSYHGLFRALGPLRKGGPAHQKPPLHKGGW